MDFLSKHEQYLASLVQAHANAPFLPSIDAHSFSVRSRRYGLDIDSPSLHLVPFKRLSVALGDPTKLILDDGDNSF